MFEIPTRVKEALEDGSYMKNYRFIVLDDNGEEDFTIDNNNLVSESVNIDERLCSEDTIKFGLCEGSHLQFEYFDFPDIIGRRIKAYIDVQYETAEGVLQWYSIPLGFFEVKKCPVQLSTGIRKSSCYNKLFSEYLDEKLDKKVKELVTVGESGVTKKLSMHTLLSILLQGYSIEERIMKEQEFNVGVSGRSYNVFTLPDANSDGTLTGGYWQIYTVSGYVVPKEYSEKDFFNFDIYAKQIYQKLKDKGIISSSRYTINGGTVYSLEEYSKTDYGYAKRIGGYAALTAVSGSQIFETEFAKVNDDKVTTGYVTNLNNGLNVVIPVMVTYGTSASPSMTTEAREKADALYNQIIAEVTVADCAHMILSPMEIYRLTAENIEKLSDITIRKMQSAVYETQCLYGRLDRETDLFSGMELNNSRLLPSQTLYPDNELYPMGRSVRARKGTYQQLWAEEGRVKKFRYLIITYKALDEEGSEIEKKLQRTVNNDGNTDYNMSDNWLFKNLVWTEEEIGTYADIMVEKMQNMTWFPFEMWCVGLPFIETGDEIEIVVGDKSYTSYVLQRQMKGIQSLSDSYINGTVNVF